ncbi:LamG domain-containing protein [Candidatus Poribacteria bacterium]|nr:LamG domain-containing protein [Candidatus Poribacteria bacterium]MYI94051.1 LamG domain-containing protein [Candidatus Poribacteria bacterium]
MLRLTTIMLSLLMLSAFILPCSAQVTMDMVAAAWLFDGNAEDFSGNGFDGDLQGGKFVDGKFGQAIELNGTNEWINIAERIGSFEEITFTHWVQSTGRLNGWRVFFNNNGWKGGDIHYQLHPNNKVEFSINGNPGGNDAFADFAFTNEQLNEWVHVATAYSATEKKIRFFIDGELDAERDWGGNPGVLDPGRIGDWGNSRQWQGLIDEFIIFNAALDVADVQSVMNDGLQTNLTAVDPKAKLAVTWGSLKR